MKKMKFYSIFIAVLILLSPVLYNNNNFKFISDGVAQAGEVTEQQVAELYVATFNRAPDAAGLTYWVNSVLAIEQISQSFFDQAETQVLYPEGTTASDFITSIYDNLYGRAPGADGLAYWVDAFDNGTMTRSVAIEAIKNGALGADAEMIANKTEVGLHYASMGLEKNNFSLSGITASGASVIEAKAAIDLLVNANLNPLELEISTPADENMDGPTLDQMYEYIAGSSKFDKLDAILILRNGKIVSEKYYNEHDKTYKSPVFSVTKGITSLLVGIASDNGVLSDTDYIMNYFSNRTVANPDSRKDLIQIKHLLTMQAGFTWNDSTDVVPLVMATMMGQDTVDYMLGQTMTADPGVTFEYNTGLGTLADGVIHGASGMHLDEYADKYLFGPLSITDYTWDKDVFNNCLGGMGLSMTARDMAKVGQMALDNGTWNGSSVVSSDWMSKSTTTTIHISPEYIGYSWRKHSSTDTWFYIPGAGGQLIDVHPDKNLVIIYKTATDINGVSTPTMPVDIGVLTDSYILPACN